MTIDEVRKRYAYCAQVPVGKTMLKMRYTEDCGFLLREVDRLTARLAAADHFVEVFRASHEAGCPTIPEVMSALRKYDATRGEEAEP